MSHDREIRRGDGEAQAIQQQQRTQHREAAHPFKGASSFATLSLSVMDASPGVDRPPGVLTPPGKLNPPLCALLIGLRGISSAAGRCVPPGVLLPRFSAENTPPVLLLGPGTKGNGSRGEGDRRPSWLLGPLGVEKPPPPVCGLLELRLSSTVEGKFNDRGPCRGDVSKSGGHLRWKC
jgi:hypothetical protein